MNYDVVLIKTFVYFFESEKVVLWHCFLSVFFSVSVSRYLNYFIHKFLFVPETVNFVFISVNIRGAIELILVDLQA